MELHRNAKSTPTSRLLLVRRVLVEGWSYAAATEGFAVSIRTVARWVRRFKEGGVAALEDASSRPGVPPHQTPPDPTPREPRQSGSLVAAHERCVMNNVLDLNT